MTEPEKMLTVSEIAECLKLSRMTVYRLVNSGEIPAVRVGRSLRVYSKDLDAYLGGARTDGRARDGTSGAAGP